MIAPVMVCVVLTGIPNPEAMNRVMAAPDSAQNPSTGQSLVLDRLLNQFEKFHFLGHKTE